MKNSYVYSSSNFVGKTGSSISFPSKNSRFKFHIEFKAYELFYSFYNHNICITTQGRKNFHIWFDLDSVHWLVESIPRLSSTKTQGLYKFDDYRALEIRLESNRRGEFIRIAEDRREGNSFLLVPYGDKGDGFKLFYKALNSFLERISFTHKGKAILSEEHPQPPYIQNDPPFLKSGEPITTSTSVSPDVAVLDSKVDEVLVASTPLLELGSPPQHSQLQSSTDDKSGGKGGLEDFSTAPLIETTPANTQMTIFEGGRQPKVIISDTYTELFPPLPRRMLSPFAPAFVPLSNNSFAALLNQDHGDLEEEDPFSMINERSLVLYSNAVEDHEKERDGPILYTHSEGEDYVFIDSKLKPLQIDLSRCPKHPLHLHKAIKGRRTYSPSQMVTRSKAKLLEAGRRNTPIGWEEEDEMHYPQESHEDEVIKFFKLCCPNKIDEPKPPNKPMSKSQKKKLKKKKNKRQVTDGFEDENYDLDYAY